MGPQQNCRVTPRPQRLLDNGNTRFKTDQKDKGHGNPEKKKKKSENVFLSNRNRTAWGVVC